MWGIILSKVFIIYIIKHVSGLPFSEHGSCLRLPPRDNASIIKLHNKTNSGTNVFPEGTHVSFFCVHRNDGVRRDDDGKLICRNGSWHGSSPRCKHLSVLNNTYHHVTAVPTPRVVTNVFSCRNKPVVLLGEVIASYEVSRTYSRKYGYPEGTRLKVNCKVGHLVPRLYNLICHNKVWTGVPRCVVSQCYSPGNVPHGEWTVISHNRLLPIVQRGWILEGVEIEYICHAGNTLVGSKNRTCLPSGKWSGAEGKCVPNVLLFERCEPPGRIPHGRITCADKDPLTRQTLSVGTVLTVSCEAGYALPSGADAVQMRCVFPYEPNGSRPRWSRPLPKCIAIEIDPKWSQDLAVVIAVSTVVMGGLLMIFTAVLACRCVRQATAGRRGRPGSPIHHHPYTVSAASMAAGHSFLRNEDCVALIVPPSYEEAIREGGAGPVSCTAGPVPATADNPHPRAQQLHNSRFAHVLSRSPRIRAGGESRDYRPLVPGGRQRRTAAAAAAANATLQQAAHGHGHGSIPTSAGEADSVSRHSTQTSGSHGPAFCLSGSLETMAVSDGTSVTLRTYESQHGGSNPSLGSTRPQTGSFGEPQVWQSPGQQQGVSRHAAVDNNSSICGDVGRHATQALSGGSEKEDTISTRS